MKTYEVIKKITEIEVYMVQAESEEKAIDLACSRGNPCFEDIVENIIESVKEIQ